MTFALLQLIALCALDRTAASQATALKRVVIFDGAAHSQGGTWVNPTTSTFQKEPGAGREGNTALELKFNDKHIWIGCGFDWFNWKAGKTIGTDTSRMTTLNFWIKSSGVDGDLQLQLLCNGDVVDTPEHHAPKMSVAKYCPDFRDGKWHEVVIPLRDMDYPKGYDPKVVTMIDFGFWTEGEADGSFVIDDLAFDNRALKHPE